MFCCALAERALVKSAASVRGMKNRFMDLSLGVGSQYLPSPIRAELGQRLMKTLRRVCMELKTFQRSSGFRGFTGPGFGLSGGICAIRVAVNQFTSTMKRGFVFALACFGLVLGLNAAEEAPNAGKPKIKFAQTVYDFGKTSQVEQVTGTFIFENVGDAPLKLGKPTTTCGCTVAGVKPDTLQPGEKGELTFSLNLGKTRAIVQKNITVDSNDPETPKVTLTVKADYTPLYQADKPTFYLHIRKGQTTNLTALVTRTDGNPLVISKIEATQPWIEAKAEPDNSSTNQAVRIHATVKPDGAPRYFAEMVKLFVAGSEAPAYTLSFQGRLVGDLTLTPESLYWPITDPTKAITSRRIILKSALSEKLEIKNISSTLKDINVETISKEDGKTMELVAKLGALPDKTTNGVIRFETNIPSQPKVEVPVWINIVKR